MRSVVVLLAAVGLASLRAGPGRPAGHRRHALRSGAGRHHGGRQLRAELGRPRRCAGERPADHGRDRPAGAARRVRRRVGWNRRADAAGARPARRPGAVRCRRALGEHVGRAGDGDGPQHRGRGALGIPAGLQQLPELQPRHHRQSQRGGDAGLWLLRRLQHGPDAGPPARCRGWPPGRTGRRHDQRAGDRPLSRGQGRGAQHHRHDRRRGRLAPVAAAVAAVPAAVRRPRATEASACRLPQPRSARRPLPATNGPPSAPWPSCRTPSRCRACRPTCST